MAEIVDLDPLPEDDLNLQSVLDDPTQTFFKVEGGQMVFKKKEPPVHVEEKEPPVHVKEKEPPVHVKQKRRNGVSTVARGKYAKWMVFTGKKTKTVGGLKKEDLEINKFGRIVSKKQSRRGHECFHMVEGWIHAVMKARSDLRAVGFVAINGPSKTGKAVYSRARQTLESTKQGSRGKAAPKVAACSKVGRDSNVGGARICRKMDTDWNKGGQGRSHSKDKPNTPKKAKTTRAQGGASASAQKRKAPRNQQVNPQEEQTREEQLQENRQLKRLLKAKREVKLEEEDDVKIEGHSIYEPFSPSLWE